MLEDGTYSIDDLMDMHEVLDEMSEYRRRAKAAAAEESKRRG